MDDLIELNCSGPAHSSPRRAAPHMLIVEFSQRQIFASRLMLTVWPAAPLISPFPPPTRVSRFQTSASCPALCVRACAHPCVCVRLCAAVCVSACVCVHPAMCAHKGRRLSLIAQAHLLILGNRLASYRQPRRGRQKKTKTEAQTSTCRTCATSGALKAFNLDPEQSAQSLWQPGGRRCSLQYGPYCFRTKASALKAKVT